MPKALHRTLFKYRIDLIPVVLVLGVVALNLWTIFFPLPLWQILLLGALLAYLKPITSLIQHNHVHLNIFHSKALNRLFDLLLSVSTGHIASEWVLHHNIGHHGNPINSLADTSSVKNSKTRRYMSKMEYIVSGSLKIYPDCCRMAWHFYTQKKPRYLRALVLESLFLLAVYAALLQVHFSMTLCFLILPNLLSRALVWLGAYWQHLNVPATSTYNSANMYTGKLFNLLSFNIGYHIAHHEQPTLHWSLLKARSAELQPRIPEQFVLSKLP